MIRVLDDPEQAARALADAVVAAAREALAAAPEFRLALSGGATPELAYALLAGPERRGAVDWSRVVLLFADERGVPPDDPGSNYRWVRQTLIEPAGIPPGRVHRLRGEAADPERAARDYEPLLETPLDLLLLGVGPDGHTASLFPGAAALAERTRRVVVVRDSPKPPALRFTITPRVIAEARAVAVLVTGAAKAEAVARALEGESDPERTPAVLMRGRDWYLDRAAAARWSAARAGARGSA